MIYRRFIKRVLDVKVGFLALLLLSPILVVSAAVVRIRMGSPVLFRQRRPGRNGRPFDILKLRTMTAELEGSGELLPDEQRLTAVGQFLRRTSIDELPELLNVIKGDMSLVGPRPLLMQYMDRYSEEQSRRHEVLPGMTGWAQVNGRNAISWEDKLAYDVWYVDNISFWLDMKVLLLTIRQVLARRGISAEGHATMPEFRGNDSD